jgi:CRP-like cAMP-binding protein
MGSAAFLKSVDLFADFTESEMKALAGLFEERRFESGTRIVAEGETADSFFIIVSGQVQVVRGPKNHFLAKIAEGQYFGEAALFQDIRRIASVEAEGPVTVMVISRDAFDRFEKKEPQASTRVLRCIIKSLVLRLEKTSAQVGKAKPTDVNDAEIERLVLDDLGMMSWKI